MGQIQSIEEFLGFLLRRAALIIAVTLLGMALSLAFAKSRLKLYQATAVLQVEPASVEAGAPSSVPMAQVLQRIEQDLTTRDAMQAVIRRHGLFEEEESLSEERQYFLLRQALRFQPINASGTAFGTQAVVTALVITAEWDDPDKAARIANDFAQSMLDYAAQGQRERVDDRVAFFEEEVARLTAGLAAIATERTDFLNANAALAPELNAARREEVIALESDLRQAAQALAALEGERAALAAVDSQRATDLRRIEALDTEIAVARASHDQIAMRQAELLAMLARAPTAEATLAELDRRKAQAETRLDAATASLTSVRAEALLAETNRTDRFSLLERARSPEDAIGANRKKIAIAGTLASLALGIALAFLYEQLFPVLRSASQMERQLGVRPIVSIPDLSQPAGLRARAWRLIDDPARPILGLPRFLVLALGLTAYLLVLAAVLG